MTALEILYTVLIVVLWVMLGVVTWLQRKTKKLNAEWEREIEFCKFIARELPKIIPCYECRFYKEGALYCPKSGMKMKDGLIYCCYGEREDSDGRND